MPVSTLTALAGADMCWRAAQPLLRRLQRPWWESDGATAFYRSVVAAPRRLLPLDALVDAFSFLRHQPAVKEDAAAAAAAVFCACDAAVAARGDRWPRR